MVSTRKRETLCRLTAALLCLCMTASTAGAALAEDATPRLAGPTQHIVRGSRVADPDTMDDYRNRLLTAANGSRYAGRVWTDKTVFAYMDGNSYTSGHFDGQKSITLDMATDGYEKAPVTFESDFAHVFSVLASSQVVNEYPPSPVDLVIVFDMSGSMGQDTRYGIDSGRNSYVEHTAHDGFPSGGVLMSDRIEHSRVQATLNAINTTIDKLMAQNPQNRVAVCGYGANAVVLMPLGHYRKVDDQPYLSVGGMETLYHPSDLVYRTTDDGLKKGGKELPSVSQDGWYWMNNRDTCYTVVVNADYNTYTGVLNANGDGNGQPDENGTTDRWTRVQKTVSNNVLNNMGEYVHAFPGAWEDDGTTPKIDYKDSSIEVYKGSSTDASARAGGKFEAIESLEQPGSLLSKAIKGTASLKAEDYVGYFTNTQGGIYLAYKQLADSAATTYSEKLTNGVESTVARIPAAIIMSDGGANFAFNEMGDDSGSYTADDWNVRYGQLQGEFGKPDVTKGYMDDLNWGSNSSTWTEGRVDGRNVDVKHRLGGSVEQPQIGDEWFNVFIPGKDTLGDKWNGLHGIYNSGADVYKDGTLTLPPYWNHAGVFYSSDNNVTGTAGVTMEVLLTASYMNKVVSEHYANGWTKYAATPESRSKLFTYTMNVDTEHVPLWGKMRLYPTLNPKDYNLNKIDEWYNIEENNDKFGTDEEIKSTLSSDYGVRDQVKKDILFKSGEIVGTETLEDGSKSEKTYTINGLKKAWEEFKEGSKKTSGPNQIEGNGYPIDIAIQPISGEVTYNAGGDDVVRITNQDVVDNIAYNDGFYDVTSGALDETFDTILALILGNVFVPVSGDNDAGVGDSVTYQDPLGEYMEIKHQSIKATPHHIDGDAFHDGEETTYDMALLVFGEMHGIVRTGVYDYTWNNDFMVAHEGDSIYGSDPLVPHETPFPMGWYKGDNPKEATWAIELGYTEGGASYPKVSGVSSPEQAWEQGWVMRLNYTTLIEYVPIISEATDPDDLSQQAQNTVYTIYRFAGSTADRNALHRNPIYGDVPQDILDAWKAASADGYPVSNDIYASTPGVYRLSDIRVWTEDTGDYVDTAGAFTPDSGYDRALYLNVPAAAVPTELAEITLGKDGVLSYRTNLPEDHKVGTDDTFKEKGDDGKEKEVKRKVTDDDYKNYCYQSTPLRLFYAVGLEEDLIRSEDDPTQQKSVNVAALSREYIADHTDPETGNIWFISNYYSNTVYEDYVTDTADTRTRGDPTVTFSPSADNRYYVFQKPLPLYAHAYRVDAKGNPSSVDGIPKDGWPADEHGNGQTVWEGAATDASGKPYTGGGAWTGGQFMGVYTNRAALQEQWNKIEEKDGKKYITDSHNMKYEVVENGIVFQDDDLLEHVTSKEDGSYAAGSTSFSSDDYFFLLVEFYLPDKKVTGKDNENKDVAGTYGGSSVQFALARKGSEFGSAFSSDKIKNGDMLCWTDTKNNLNIDFEYVSRSDTGDNTRGEPTYEKLFYTDETLKTYLESLNISTEEFEIDDPENPGKKKTTSQLGLQKAYWEAQQANPIVIAQIDAVRKLASDKYGNEDEDNLRKAFGELFRFAVAARRGGIRTGDMSNNRQAKSPNATGTAYSYYLPSVSGNSGTDDGVILNNYLGNNGRLEIANAMLMVTKRVEGTPGIPLPTDANAEEFLYQLYVEGLTGKQNASVVYYDPFSGTWRRQVAYIDVLTDNSDLLQTNNNERALFDYVGGTARQVVADGVDESGNPIYFYANEDGTPSAEKCDTPFDGLYYLYLPPNEGNTATGETEAHTRRLYQDSEYKGSDALLKLNDGNRLVIYYGPGQEPSQAQKDEDGEKGISYAEAGGNYPAGTQAYWAYLAELIPVTEVQEAEAAAASGDSPGDGPSTIALEEAEEHTWQHSTENHGAGKHLERISYTLVVSRPEPETSESSVTSPFKTRSMYLSKEIEFGVNANDKKEEGDAGVNEAGKKLEQGDLYDTVVPSGDRPDLFGGLSNAQIAANTAEFTLRSGWGLLLTGLDNRIAYRYTEKLTADQIKEGYTLKQLTHIQQLGSESVYRPGLQEIPVYSRDGATYGAYYPAPYQNAPTENGLTWAVNRSGQPNDASYLTYEPFGHTNAVMWAYYATMPATGSDSVGNHHHRTDAAVTETAPFFNQSAQTDLTHTVLPNPSCAACDVPVRDESGNVTGYRHYMYRDGQLVDPHYEGEASAFLRNMSRYLVSPTVHFAVEDESQPGAAYTGVYSSFGNTGYFEEQSHFVNTVVKNALSVEKWLAQDVDAELTEEDRGTEFAFTLSLYEGEGTTGDPLDGPYAYTVTETDAAGNVKIVRCGSLLDQDKNPVDGYKAPDGFKEDPVPVAYAADIDGTGAGGWRFTLKGGQTLTVSGLPDAAPYTYTVTETLTEPQLDAFTPNQQSVTRTVNPGATGVMAANPATFVNTKRPPEPAQIDLLLTKTLVDPSGKYDWRNKPFLFAVMPSQDNPAGDPVRTLSGYDPASNLFTLKTGSDAFAAGRSAVLTVFDKLPFARAGRYHYSISEMIPAAPEQSMRYDSAVYQVTVDVTPAPDAPMRLAATVTVAQGGARKELVTFENHYDRKPDLPLTGDDSPVALWLALAALSGLAMCALCAARLREKKGAGR